MDLSAIQIAMDKFVMRHAAGFQTIAAKETQALEAGALMLATVHYQRKGYTLIARNLQRGFFKLKLGKGYPWNFSWWEVAKDGRRLELHGNLSIQSAYKKDQGVYMVDVGVVETGHTPSGPRPPHGWAAYPNAALATFVEAKKLEIYPMLLAQFVGIVHEIKPLHVRRSKKTVHPDDFFPALVSIGSLRGTSRRINDAFVRRGFRVNILPGFDREISRLAGDETCPSPFRP